MKIVNLCPFCEEVLPNRDHLKSHIIHCNRMKQDKSIPKKQSGKRVEVVRIRSVQNFEAPETAVPGRPFLNDTGSLIRIMNIKNFHL